MRRTYKSKRDIGGGLDHRDMLFNMDEKSSAFDAFYIQNIKQTKREQSCMGSSNNNGAASNKVRKRKYVKRRVKEVEPQPTESHRESVSGSVFLTPDKSLRVNKAPDLFDQLLNSSPACPEVKQLKKVDPFDLLLAGTPKETKTYNRKKKLIKKFNISSNESSVSDKENACKNNELSTQNTTDIKSHELIIEKEAEPSPKFDESINNIVRKLSLINNINRKNSGSLKKTFKYNKNRLTKNFPSPAVKNSPLSSTPFIEKTRSKSIYEFSPIPMGDLEDSNYVTITENDQEVNKSVVFIPKNSSNALKRSQNEDTPVLYLDANYGSKCKGNSDPLFSSDADTQENLLKNDVISDKNSSKYKDNKEINSLQISEIEPFLGFSDETIDKVNENLLSDEEKHYSIIISTGKFSKSSQKSKEISIDNNEVKNNTKEENKNTSVIEYSTPLEPFFGFTKQSDSIIHISATDHSLPSKTFLSFAEVETHNNESVDSAGHISQNTVSDSVQNNSISFISREFEFNEDPNYNKIVDNEYHDLQQIKSYEEQDDSNNDISTAQNKMSNKLEVLEITPKSNNTLDSDDDDSDRDQNNYSSFISRELEFNEDPNNKSVHNEYQVLQQIDSYDGQDDSVNNISTAENKISNKLKPLEITLRSNNTLDSDDDDDITQISQIVNSHEEYNSSLSSFSSQSEQQNHSCNDKSSEEQDSEYDNKQSSYDTCNSNEFLSEENSVKEPIVSLEKMDVNLFKNYYKKMPVHNSRKPVVAMERLNIDLFKEYYDNMPNYKEDNSAEELSEEVSESYASFDDSDYNVEEESEQNSQSTYAENDITSTESDIDTSSQGTSSENRESIGDKSVSYVTTRRRNEPTNNSDILGLDDSQDSSSTECDKTVLSNKVSIPNPTNTDVPAIITNVQIDDNDVVIEPIGSKSPILIISNVTTRKSARRMSSAHQKMDISKTPDSKPGIILQPGKKWERSLSIYRRITMSENLENSLLEDGDLHAKGRKYRQSVINTMEMQDKSSLHNESIQNRRSTFVSKPSRSTIRIVKETNTSRLSLSSTAVFDDLTGFLEDCDDTLVELSKLSIIDHDVTVIEKFHEASRIATARDYVLRRCNQSDTVPFDECYPDPLLKNCRKIGEGVYGEVFLWRAPDGRARVMKVVPIAGTVKVNGEHQKDFHEIIAEIVIAMELSALRAPIAEIDCLLNEGKHVDALDLHSVENATDVFNEVLAVKCVYGSYPSRLLDLWELYDETKGSENDNPAILPVDQQYIVLELANAGQDLESYQFNSADQAHALFLQVAFGLAVGEEAFQFEHRDLHWGNVLIAPTDQKYATFVLRGRAHRVARRGVAATIIDYSLSRVSLPLSPRRPGAPAEDQAALYNDLATDDGLFGALGDYQFEVYRLMRDKLGNDWKNFEPYTNILWLHYTVDKMITALRYKRTNTKTHKQFINKLKGIKERILEYGSAAQFVLTDNEF